MHGKERLLYSYSRKNCEYKVEFRKIKPINFFQKHNCFGIKTIQDREGKVLVSFLIRRAG